MRKHRFLGGLGLAVGSALLSACGAPSDEAAQTGSEAALTEGAFIQDNSPYYWAPSSFDDFRAATASLAPQSPVLPALAEDDPLTIRMQAWLDRVDAVVRPAMEAKLGAPLVAPKPLARVLQSRSTFNAWVSGVPACLGVPLGAGAPGTSAYLQSASIQPTTGTGITCLKPAAWNADSAVKFWDDGKPACALSLAGGALKAGGTGCTIDPGATTAADVMITSTGNYVQFTTDLLAEVDDTTVGVVAAHELGHYYLGHSTDRGAANYGFWYTRDDLRKTTPVRAPNSADLEAAYKEVIQAGRPLGGPTFASHFSGRMRPLLLSGIAPLLIERQEPDFVCAAARDALGPWVQQIVQGEAPPQDAQKSFVDFETKLVKCAPQLALSGDPSARPISAGMTLFAAAHYRPGPNAKTTLHFGDSLGPFLDRIDVQAKALDAKAQKLVQRLQDNKIGLYTIEQAADEFAMQMASKMGFTTDEILAGWVDFMRAIDRVYARSFTPDQLVTWRQQSAELDADTCAALMAADFMKDGARVTMNMGQLDEPHHTSCYRLYNLWREGRAQQFVPGARLPALTPEWSTLRSEAASLASQAQL